MRQGAQHLQRRVERVLADARQAGDQGGGGAEPDRDAEADPDAGQRDEEILRQFA